MKRSKKTSRDRLETETFKTETTSLLVESRSARSSLVSHTGLKTDLIGLFGQLHAALSKLLKSSLRVQATQPPTVNRAEDE